MIELERHIEILLLSNDCVIVPGLGGFMAHHIDASYDEEDNTFLPPTRTLGFNPQLTINDSLLTLSYVEAYDISYPEALKRLEDEINELKMRIENDGSYDINDVGTLSLNEDGNYIFTPCQAGILTPELYGLSSFQMKKVTEEPEEQVQTKKQPTTVAKTIAMPLSPESYDTDEAENNEDEEIVKVKFSWIRNAVAVAAILLAVFLLALPTGKTEMMTRTISNLNNNILFGMMSEDTNTSKIEIKKIDINQPARNILPKDSSTLVKQEKTDSVKQGYCIVLASYVTKKNAEIFIENLKQRGYEDAHVFIHNNVTRVVYGNFKTQGEAYQALKDIHQHKDLAEAWVYKFNS